MPGDSADARTATVAALVRIAVEGIPFDGAKGCPLCAKAAAGGLTQEQNVQLHHRELSWLAARVVDNQALLQRPISERPRWLVVAYVARDAPTICETCRSPTHVCKDQRNDHPEERIVGSFDDYDSAVVAAHQIQDFRNVAGQAVFSGGHVLRIPPSNLTPDDVKFDNLRPTEPSGWCAP